MEEDKSTAEKLHKFDLSSFAKSQDQMIATNDNAYKGAKYSTTYRQTVQKIREYSYEEIARITESGTTLEQQKMSRNYFYKDGYYKQIIIYYATLLKYSGLLIPNPSAGKSLSTPNLQKRYFSAMDYVEKMRLPQTLTNCAYRALVDGCYYGVITDLTKESFTLIDLPANYCCSRYKDPAGNDLIEFNLTYFDDIVDLDVRKAALQVYPKEIARAYKEFKKRGDCLSKWYVIPSDLGVCFPVFDGRPIFLNVIPKTIEYDNMLEVNYEKEEEEIKKIIVQQIPHLTDGRLLFEPDEAEEIHKGTVGMLKGNPHLSVLTTYGDVNPIVAKTTSEGVNDTLKKYEENIYAQAGVSSQIFTANTNLAMEYCLDNDLAFMMILANKFATFIGNHLTRLFGNGNITFKYTILPLSHYNQKDFVDTSFKLVNSGYSLLLPAIGMGLSQKDIGNIKDLENDVLKLDKKLKPLATAYTQSQESNSDGADSSDEGGRPEKDSTEKSDKTLDNQN